MKKSSWMIFVLMGVCLVVFTATPAETQAEQPQSEEEAPLKVTLRTDKTAYFPDETIRLEIQITNMSNETIYVTPFMDIGWGGEFRPHIHKGDLDGEELPRDLPHGGRLPPGTKKENYISLRPSSFSGRVFWFTFENWSPEVHAPGEYTIVIMYFPRIFDSWVKSIDEIKDLNIWTYERGLLLSNPISITILPSENKD